MVGVTTTTKFVELVALPPGVTTEIAPLVAPAGTVAINLVPLSLKLAAVPLKFTWVAVFKLEPVIVTVVPTPPLAGENPVIDGERFVSTVNVDELVPVPPLVVTAIGPLVEPVGTVAVICVSEFPLKPALVPLNVTRLAPVSPVPVTVTDAPTPPLVGVKPVTVGAGMTVKLVAVCAVPPGVVTVITPVLAPAGTAAVS